MRIPLLNIEGLKELGRCYLCKQETNTWILGVPVCIKCAVSSSPLEYGKFLNEIVSKWSHHSKNKKPVEERL